MMNSWAWSLAFDACFSCNRTGQVEAQGGGLRINRHWDWINTVLSLEKHVEQSGFITLEGRDAFRKMSVDS